MSTEAQRAPVPPRPTAPPRPAAPPDAHGNPGRTTGATPPPPTQGPQPTAPARQGTAPADR
ncbi:protease, partial [Streptomyces sp. NPDC079189]